MSESKRILALNPWHGGSHRAFLEGWIEHSGHEFTVLSLPPARWKWRMRHGAITFAEQLREDSQFSESNFDGLVCTDMLNLAEFRGLAPGWIRDLPTIVYFHENQLTYPVREEHERDLHFAMTNLTSCLASDEVWFNSAWHRDEFLKATGLFLKKMPDFVEPALANRVREKSSVQPPGIEPCPIPTSHRAGPLRIAWVARWEHDKNPELFFDALFELESRGVDFRVSVLGESFAEVPDCFPVARQKLAGRIDHWGFAESRKAYWQVLAMCDVVVSTAAHEFFGIAILEAVSAGCFPLVPWALAYPETLGESSDDWFHNGTVEGIVDRLESLARKQHGILEIPSVDRFFWRVRASEMDERLEQVIADLV